MKKIVMLLVLVFVVSLFAPLQAVDVTWYTDIAQAEKVAQSEKKPLLLFFTGSDWCPWCVKLVDQILSKQAFKDYASESLVLVKLDFPKRTQMDAKQKEHNYALAKKHQVQGFPTIILLNAKGDTLGQTGYQDLTPEAYVEHIKTFVK